MAVDSTRAIISVDTFKTGAGIDPNEDTNEDALQVIINGVSLAFDTHCNRQFVQKTDTDIYIDGSGLKTLDLPNMPITTLTNLYYDDVLLTVGKDNDYIVYGDEGAAYVYKTSGVWVEGRQIVKIGSLIGGYPLATMPHDIKLACIKQVDHEFKGFAQSRWGESRRSFEGGSVDYETGALLQSVQDVLEKYIVLYG